METLISTHQLTNILKYYMEAGPDYAYWSNALHMHFGLARFTQFWNREEMLEELSDEIVRRLELACGANTIGDFGCGVGATMRRAANRNHALSIKGVTLVPWQKARGDQLSLEQNLGDRLEIRLEDYHKTTMPSRSMDGVYAIESACYSPPELQKEFFKETARVLKPGARLVVADGFLKTGEESLSPLVTRLYRAICRNWALPGLMNINRAVDHMKTAGFKSVRVEEVSWRIAPSVLHVPFVIIKFLIAKKITRHHLSEQSIRNLKGSFQTLLLGLIRRDFGYFIVTAQK